MRAAGPEESVLVMAALHELRTLLTSGRIPELITRHHALTARVGEHQRLLQTYVQDYLLFFDALIREAQVMKIDEELLAVTRSASRVFGDNDCISFELHGGKPMIIGLPEPLREIRKKKDRWRRSDDLINGVDARIRRHLTRLGIPERANPDGALLTGRFAWSGVTLTYRDEMSETDLPIEFHESAQLALSDNGFPPAGVGQEFWLVGDMGEGEFPLFVDAQDDIASNPLIYRGDSELPTGEPEILGSLSTVLTRCQRD